jgi:hypothetical protein
MPIPSVNSSRPREKSASAVETMSAGPKRVTRGAVRYAPFPRRIHVRPLTGQSAPAASRSRPRSKAATAATRTATRTLDRQLARFDQPGLAGKGHGTLR